MMMNILSNVFETQIETLQKDFMTSSFPCATASDVKIYDEGGSGEDNDDGDRGDVGDQGDGVDRGDCGD